MTIKSLSTGLAVAVLASGVASVAVAASSAPGAKPAKSPSAADARRAAMVPIQDDPRLPRVLLIGDSIAMGYTLPLRQLLAGKANVHYPEENCHTSRQILERLDKYLGDKPWDIIQFNCGIHDITRLNEAGRAIKAGESGKVQVPIDEYRENLEKIVARLQQTHAALIWCATTPVADNLPHRHPADITGYNQVAKEIMTAAGIPITDLPELIARRGKPKWQDGVHFTIEGTREMAQDLAPAIEAALARRSSTVAEGVGTASTRQAIASTPGPGASMRDRRKAAAAHRRRLIFNNDGNEPPYHMKSPSAKELLDLRTTGLVGSQVDSIFYCTWSSGFGLFTHFTKVGQIFTTCEGRYSGNQMPALVKAGIDPLRVMVDFGKQHGIEVFWSMRMNDTHDGSTADYGPLLFQTNRLKLAHPDYLLGTPRNRPKHGSWTAVNYGLPEVRELAFRYIEEVCRNYDVDGVELDFFRHPVCFKSTARGQPATAAERAAMTELLRRIRQMADEVGQARGRPILIAVRSPDSAEYCRAIGLDLEYWLANDLLDLWVPAGYFQLNDWNYSVALGHRYGVKVYPSLDESRVRDATARELRMTELAYRGRAADVWGSGADGVYMFNFTNPKSALWRQLGDPQVLAGLDKDYFASPRGVANAAGGNLPYAPYQTIETLNPGNTKAVAPGKSATARINVGEDLSQAGPVKLTLRLQFKTAMAPQLLEVLCNDQPLSLLGTNQSWVEYSVSPSVVHRAANQVKVTLAAGAPRAIWTDLMLEERH